MEVDNSVKATPGELALKMEGEDDAGMAQFDEKDETPPIFRLTGKAEKALLRWVSVGEGGLQGLFNLRIVSQTTKDWVEDFLPIEGRRLFSKAQVTVDVKDGRSVADFLRTPPPPEVTSLSLQVDWLLCCEEKDCRRFLTFWAGRLESLEVNELRLPLCSRLQELVSSASLRSLRCHTLHCSSSEDFPDFLLRLEEFAVVTLEMKQFVTRQLLKTLTTCRNLKQLQMPMTDVILHVINLIQSRKDDRNFQLTMRGIDHWTPWMPLFVTSVAKSKSSIRLEEVRVLVRPNFWEEVLDVGEDFARKFWSCVSSVSRWTSTGEGHRPFMADFPNLKRLDLLQGGGEWEFPDSLQHLGVEGGNQLHFLPGSLTSLDIKEMRCSVNELLESLTSVATRCPLLETLYISWEFTGDSKTPKRAKMVGGDSQRVHFPKLRSIILSCQWTQEQAKDASGGIRLLLSEGFGLPRLPLTTFTLKVTHLCGCETEHFRVFDVKTTTAFLEGPVGKTLCALDVDKLFVEDDALPWLQKLEKKVEENRRRRRETLGKRRCE